MGTQPTLAQVRAWITVPVTILDDQALQQVYDAETAKQAAVCTIPEDPDAFPAPLAQALYRRVARECAARNLPLGIMGDGVEYAPARLSRFDAQVESHEGPYRVMVVA